MRQNFVRLSVQDDVPDRKTPVSKFLAAAAFIIVSAQSAVGKDHQIECDRYSSAASGQRTVLQFQQDPNRADFILERQGIQQYWHFGGSLGTSLEGTIYTLSDYPNSKGNILYGVSIILDHSARPTQEITVLIFQDMAFWPDCT